MRNVNKFEVQEGSCFCGGVKAVGLPVATRLCHCEPCRTWHATPVNDYSFGQTRPYRSHMAKCCLQIIREKEVTDTCVGHCGSMK